MCVIIICPKGKDIDQGTLELAMERNPQGWGMSTRTATGFKVYKGFSEAEAWRKWTRMGNAEERVFHARVATHGPVNVPNLHPFDASYRSQSKVAERLFYHNGTVTSIPQFIEDRSDSWHVATMLRSFPTTKHFIDKIADLARRESSRFVLCLEDMTWRFGSGWIQRDDVFYSNGSALGKFSTRRRAWAGGLLHAPGTLADTACEGFKYDPETKMYTPDPNYKPPDKDYDENDNKPTIIYPSRGGLWTEHGGYRTADWNWWDDHQTDNEVKVKALPPAQRETVGWAVNPIYLDEHKGLAYRYADREGTWWEVGEKKGERKLCFGPLPGTCIYEQPNRVGVGLVISGPKQEVVGRYDFFKVSDEIIKMFDLTPWNVRNPRTRPQKWADWTMAEWEAVEEADSIHVFEGWTSNEIREHYRRNGGSLHPLPKFTDNPPQVTNTPT